MRRFCRFIIQIVICIVSTLYCCNYVYANTSCEWITVSDSLELMSYVMQSPECNLFEEGLEDINQATLADEGRVVVYAKELNDTYDASRVIAYDDYSEYVLCFDSVDLARQAYELIQLDYANCYLDEEVSVDLYGGINNTNNQHSWGYNYMGFDYVTNNYYINNLQNRVMVAVIDTGINKDSHYFDNRCISDKSYNFVNSNKNIYDKDGHGTHIAGVIADCTPSNVDIMMLKVYNDWGKTTWLTINSAIQYAKAQGADIINMSLGLARRDGEPDYNELDTALMNASESGISVICAAGNDGYNVERVYPACNANTIAVSAVNQQGAFVQEFDGGGGSSYGEAIDFCAPGVDIVSAGIIDNTDVMSGTSSSAAFVSAALACIKLENYDCSIDKLYQLASEHATDLGESGKDDYYGWGCINVKYLADKYNGTKDIESASIELLGEGAYIYTGTSIEPNIKVYSNGMVLTRDIDYSVEYINNINAGEGTIIVKGLGMYYGSLTKSFDICKAVNKISAKNVSVVTSQKAQNVKFQAKCKSKTQLTYSCSNKKIKIDSKGQAVISKGYVGKAVVTIKSSSNSNYDGDTKVVTITVMPEATKVVALKSTENNRLRLKWKKCDNISGYQVQYSRTSDFAKGKTKVKSYNNKCRDTIIGGLKSNKTYYVRVRTYKIVKGEKIYSKWSSTKKAKIK